MERDRLAELWGPLHGLIVLEEQGSFTAAAARLGISKAAMSQRMAELERAVGATLVRRTTRSMRLTEVGQRLVEETRASFHTIAHGLVAARDTAGEPRGLLRVTAPVALGRQHVVPLVASFLQRHPAIRLQLDLSDRLASLATEGFDLAIRHVASPPDTHVAWVLCETQSVLVASQAYLAAQGEPTNPDDLMRHNCLQYPRGHGQSLWAFEPQRAAGAGRRRVVRQSVPITGTLAANNSEALRDAAEAGLGIALLPDFTAQAALQAGTLVHVLPQWRPVDSFAPRIHAVRPYSAHVPRAVSLFVEHLREGLRGGFSVGG